MSTFYGPVQLSEIGVIFVSGKGGSNFPRNGVKTLDNYQLVKYNKVTVNYYKLHQVTRRCLRNGVFMPVCYQMVKSCTISASIRREW